MKDNTAFEVVRKYRFYAAHRNQNLNDKCRNIHGHTYKIEVHLVLQKQEQSGVSMLFSDIDKLIEPIIQQLDHSFILDKNDALYEYLLKFNEPLKMYVLDAVTSVENLSEHLTKLFRSTGLNVTCVKVAETESSVVTYLA
jgi:6-pyruvoyltetrahydropterin/6-carboxytetrahydropterin synthase